jgi:cold shock CspA family protein
MSTDNMQTGCVKWFNNTSGFGFITIINSDDEKLIGKDIFIHHSALVVSETQFRYLVQGEYVNFLIIESDKRNEDFQASNVTGINKGHLMCETRFLNSSDKPVKKNNSGNKKNTSKDKKDTSKDKKDTSEDKKDTSEDKKDNENKSPQNSDEKILGWNIVSK